MSWAVLYFLKYYIELLLLYCDCVSATIRAEVRHYLRKYDSDGRHSAVALLYHVCICILLFREINYL